jgi:hypothetical protein
MDIGGLAPGLYRIRMAGPDQERQAKLVEIRAGDTRVIDGSAAASEMAHVTIESESSGSANPVGVELTDTEKGTRFTSLSQDVFFRAHPAAPSAKEQHPMVLQVPPGRYEVHLVGRDAYLLGISAKGAEVAGRRVTVHGGDVTLKLRTAAERAFVHGIASVSGRPVEGAMILLVPAGLNDPGSFADVVRDQTNTDGSFDLNDIVPGQYILIAVSDGWQIQWNDIATLQRYLTQGIPLELRPGTKVDQDVSAQQP